MTKRLYPTLRILLGFLFLSMGVQAAAQTVKTDSLYSLSLGRVKRVTLLVPAQQEHLAVLVLLHGYGGSNIDWTARTEIERYVDGSPLLVVMPDGENSWYVNQLGKRGGGFEDFIIQDVLLYVRSLFSIDTTRIAIAGLSMGGYGALVLGMRHPEIFSFIGALSASLDIPRGIPELERNNRSGLRASLVSAFGSVPSDFWMERDPFRLVTTLPPDTVPYLYLANGIQDEFRGRLSLYRAFADSARVHGVHYEYRETPGRHDWAYWDREIRGIIFRLKEQWGLPE